uniref:Uncharacterized protein n=1 Tax=Otolemur garnettii TaxID=30611 RepID=H0X7C4_OTOGA
MSEQLVDIQNLMPTERKSTWRTVEERRMSDLTRVLEWLERRKGKKKQAIQRGYDLVSNTPAPKAKRVTNGITNADAHLFKWVPRVSRALCSHSSYVRPLRKREGQIRGVQQKGTRFSLISSAYARDSHRKSGKGLSRKHSLLIELDIKDAIALESIMQRPASHRRQSSGLDPAVQENIFGRRPTFLREWTSKTSDPSYERKLKNLMEKGMEPKVETAKMLKPEEVLSCRYLRLSKNNIRTLLKLCRDAGMVVDIHPHMIEREIDSRKVFGDLHNVAL